MNALYALDSGFTGQGVVVGVIDDGAVNVNGELTGRIDTGLSRDFGYVTSGDTRTKRNELGSAQADHGTAVANIIAGNRNGAGAMGYAPDATIAVLRIADWNADTSTETLTHFTEALDYATANHIKVVNHSLRSGGGTRMANALDRFAATAGLFVSSAGNEAEAIPGDAAALTEVNRRSVLFVGALGTSTTGSYQLASYSSRAGSAMDRYVVAPGQNVTTTVTGDTATFDGTSSAAPVVSALAADILSKWPQLTGQQAGEIILTTAKDIGDPGVDAVFGHGLVDFRAALAPVEPTLSNGTVQSSASSSQMSVPSSMGLQSLQTAVSNVTVLDAYGRDYHGSVADLIVRPESQGGHWLRRRISQMSAGGRASLGVGPFTGSLGITTRRLGGNDDGTAANVAAGTVAYADGGTVYRAAWKRAGRSSGRRDGPGALCQRRARLRAPGGQQLRGRNGWSAAAGWVSPWRSRGAPAPAPPPPPLAGQRGATDLRVSLIGEDNTIMGASTGEGALRLGRGATTAMIEAHQVVSVAAGWSVEGYGSLGITRLKTDAASPGDGLHAAPRLAHRHAGAWSIAGGAS